MAGSKRNHNLSRICLQIFQRRRQVFAHISYACCARTAKEKEFDLTCFTSLLDINVIASSNQSSTLMQQNLFMKVYTANCSKLVEVLTLDAENLSVCECK